ncbi:MAG: EAL domain-containing protein [Desulfuromonadaceae bacterium]|nr:EAL domain-containing protein [Desulfuromonadaceae bacterium]
MKIAEYIFRSASSFRTKQRLVIMLACSIVLVVTLLCFLVYSFYTFNRESRERLEALSDIVGADVGAALAFGDDQAVSKSLSAIKADPSIKRLFILNDNEQISAHYHRGDVGPPVDLLRCLNATRSESRQHFFKLSPSIERPIMKEGVRLGTILIEQDEHVITEKIVATSAISLFILSFALGFSYLLADRFQRIITDPVTAIATTMQEVSYTKDYSKRVSASDTDEMNTLAERFNEMLSEIERRDEDLLERQEQLHHMANFDVLTGLPNRVLFNDRLEQALLRASRTGDQLAVLFIDLDDFKMINDTHGHRTGDQLLLETAARLSAGTRAGDTLARLGGDEFTVFLQDIKSPESALSVARKHIKTLFVPYQIDEKRLFVSASIGVALFPSHGTTAETLVKNADSAMYLAKEKGKNNVELFTDSLHTILSERLGLCNDLHRALEQEEFELYYQPRVNLERNTWASAEALIRWNHPELGMVSPDKFIPLAEQTGLILQLGEWVIREACRQLHQWHAQGFYLPRISVNVSPLQLQRQDLLGIVKETLTENRLCTQALELEIVESALVEDMGRSITILRELKEIGVKISIDDFGTGYSSLSYLRTLPVDILKIDRSFLLNVHESEKDEQILAAIIAMSLSLGLEVVTEGVESVEQGHILRKHKCQDAQGYYFARPMPAEEFFQRFTALQPGLERFRFKPSGCTKTFCCMLSGGSSSNCGHGTFCFAERRLATS